MNVIEGILKTQDPELMVEVRLFDRDSLDNTSTVKRNLQPVRLLLSLIVAIISHCSLNLEK
jgi:hypothetical protein